MNLLNLLVTKNFKNTFTMSINLNILNFQIKNNSVKCINNNLSRFI